jgi:hypothetical protein
VPSFSTLKNAFLWFFFHHNFPFPPQAEGGKVGRGKEEKKERKKKKVSNPFFVLILICSYLIIYYEINSVFYIFCHLLCFQEHNLHVK